MRPKKYTEALCSFSVYIPLSVREQIKKKADILGCSENEVVIHSCVSFLVDGNGSLDLYMNEKKDLQNKVMDLQKQLADREELELKLFNPDVEKWVDIGKRFVQRKQAMKTAYGELVAELRKQFKDKTTSFYQKKQINEILTELSAKAKTTGWLIGGVMENEV